jgi:Lon protease-like protein
MTLLELSATGLVPLFPLPDVCLLPGESLPFYVFEPRYRRMLADALASEKLIALARLQPGFDGEYGGNPPVYPCMGVGEIVAHRPRGDGTSEIVLRGIARARLCDVVKPLPYRLGRLVDLPEVHSDREREAAAALALRDALAPLESDFRRIGCDLDRLCAADDLAWRVAVLLDLLPSEKQALLESDDRVARLERLLPAVGREEHRARMRLLLTQIALRRDPSGTLPDVGAEEGADP